METTNASNTNTSKPIPEHFDIEKLRIRAIEQAFKLSKKIWTDNNEHDPGVTLLEILAFALADIGYRTSFDIKDILTQTKEDGKQTYIPTQEHLFVAEEILPSHPVTLLDYKKLILENVEGVHNANVCIANTANIKGFYDVYIELEGENTRKYNVKKEVYNLFRSHRNLCEDIRAVNYIEPVFLNLNINLELDEYVSKYDIPDIVKEVFKTIYNYITPPIQHYSVSELLDKGISMEEVLQNPLPKIGFIDKQELSRFKTKTTIYYSDILALLMKIKGVKNIPYFEFVLQDESEEAYVDKHADAVSLKKAYQEQKSFRLDLDTTQELKKSGLYHQYKEHFPIIIIEPEEAIAADLAPKNNVRISQNGLCFNYSPYVVKSSIIQKEDEKILNDITKPVGRYRGLDRYKSIQYEFPSNYKIGRESLGTNHVPQGLAQQKQFQAFLLFFDQLLADYLTQLKNVHTLFSWSDPYNHTYLYKHFTNEDIPNFSHIFTNYSDYHNILESLHKKQVRKNKFLNHLLARFGETFVNYANAIYQYKGDYINTPSEEIRDKTALLAHYPLISTYRSRAFDYSKSIGKSNFTVLEYRIAKMIGLDRKPEQIYKKLAPHLIRIIKNTNTSGLDDNYAYPLHVFKKDIQDKFDRDFGLHIYEHHMFKSPYTQRGYQAVPALKIKNCFNEVHMRDDDTYAFWCTVVLPAWHEFSQSYEFRKMIEERIRYEIPPHIKVQIYWLDPVRMYNIECHYDIFLKIKKELLDIRPTKKQKTAYNKALGDLVNIFNGLENMYIYNDKLSDAHVYLSKGTGIITTDMSALCGKKCNWTFE